MAFVLFNDREGQKAKACLGLGVLVYAVPRRNKRKCSVYPELFSAKLHYTVSYFLIFSDSSANTGKSS